MNRELKFGNRIISYELTFGDRKTMGVKVYPDCSVKVAAPLDTPFDKIKTKLKSRAPWIVKQQNEFLSYHPLTPKRKFINGETHLYLGRQYRLKIEKSNFKNDIKLYGGRFLVYRMKGEKVETILKQWYREKAEIHFNDILQQKWPLFQKYNILYPELQIRKMAKRWGSCTAKDKIILNPELIKAPKGSIEYVIIHELCHLVHHNHTRTFYALQRKMMPDCEKWKERLEYSLAYSLA